MALEPPSLYDALTVNTSRHQLDLAVEAGPMQTLREETLLVETLHRIGNALTSELDPETIAQTVVAEATTLTGARFGVFGYEIVGAGGERQSRYTMSGAAATSIPATDGPARVTPIARLLRGTTAVRSDDVRRDPRFGETPPHAATPFAHLPLVSYLTVPVTSHTGELLGGLFFGHDEPRAFAERHERLVIGIAGWAAIAMDNARLFEAQRAARAEAERANRAKSDFLAAMSHELRTPLNAIGGFAQLVEDELYGPITEQQRDAMRRVRRAQEHLLTLINDILNFAKIEAGRLQLHLQEVDVGDTVRELTQLVEPQISGKGLALAAVDGPAHARVLADRARLQQILLNLLGNAIKFTDAGSIAVTWAVDVGAVRIGVRDTGRGVPADQLPRIFEPFEQAAREGKAREGVGLGLAISRELARAMGGDVTVRSVPGEGSEFVVTLPPARSASCSPPRG